MTRSILYTTATAVCMTVGVSLMMAVPTQAETPVGSNIDSRLVLAFAADGDAVQAMMPDGWTSVSIPRGAMAGANMIVLLIDRHLAMDAEGNPLDPPHTRSSALVAPGTHPDVEGARLFVLRQYEMGSEGGAYGTTIPAAISRTATLEGPADGPRMHRESWVFAPATGGAIEVSLSYTVGTPGWGPGTLRPYSPIDTDFNRIYRYDQLADVAMSAELGRDLDGELSFKTTIDDLAGVFDGSEQVRAVISVPVYAREVSLP